jgi:hypothetical protein
MGVYYMSKQRCQQNFTRTKRKVDELNGMLNIHIQLKIYIPQQKYYPLGRDAVWSDTSLPKLGRNILHPSSGSKSKSRERASARKETWDKQRKIKYSTACLAYSSTLKMEEVSSSGTSVNFYRTIRRYILEDSGFYTHCRENLKSHIFHVFELGLIFV